MGMLIQTFVDKVNKRDAKYSWLMLKEDKDLHWGTPKGRERSCNIQEQEQEDGPCSSKLLSTPYKTNAVISYRVDRLNDDDFSLACTGIVQHRELQDARAIVRDKRWGRDIK